MAAKMNHKPFYVGKVGAFVPTWLCHDQEKARRPHSDLFSFLAAPTVAESFKFVRLFPLNQTDLPPQHTSELPEAPQGVSTLNPTLDYTPPSFITLMFTDLGVLTPSAVSDELIKLYC